MILRSLEIRSFRCIRQLHVNFAEGLNVLYGPNELGKSTLVEALRAAFLLPVNSKIAEDFVPWGTDETPMVIVEFESPKKETPDGSGVKRPTTQWRIKKSFGRGRNQSAILERLTSHGRGVERARGRDVDGQLRALLDLGIHEPGGRGAPRGWPQSYLITALLGEQEGVAKIFDVSLNSDGTDSGRKRLTDALGVLAQAPEVTGLLERLNLRTRDVFTEKGMKRRTQDSPLVRITERKRSQQSQVDVLETEHRRSKEIQCEISDLRKKQQQCDAMITRLDREVELLSDLLKKRELVADYENRRSKLEEALNTFKKADEDFQNGNAQRQQLYMDMQSAEQLHVQAKQTLASHVARLKQLNESRSEWLESRRRQIEAKLASADQIRLTAQRVLEARRNVIEQQGVVSRVTSEVVTAHENLQRAARSYQLTLEDDVVQAEQHVSHAESVTKFASVNLQRDQLKSWFTTFANSEQDLQRWSREAKQAEDELCVLKSKRATLQKARNDSLDEAKKAWEQKQKHVVHQRQLEDDYRKTKATEQKVRSYLNNLIRFDEVKQHLEEKKEIQIGLLAEREASEQQQILLTDKLVTATRSVSLWQSTALGCVFGSLLTLVLSSIFASGRVVMFSLSGFLGITFIGLVLRWRQFSNQRKKVSDEREKIRHTLDRLSSEELITNSELASAQRECELCQRSLPNEFLKRFENLAIARSWLEEKLPRTAKKRRRLEQEISALDQSDAGAHDETDQNDASVAFDSQINQLDEQITTADENAKSSRTLRDQAHTRYEDVRNSMSDGNSKENIERRMLHLDSQFTECIVQLKWPENCPIPTVDDAEHELSLARQELLAAKSACDSRAETLASSNSSSLGGQYPIYEFSDVTTAQSVEVAEQQWRLASSEYFKADSELKQQQTILTEKESAADQLAREIGRPPDDLIEEANQALADLASQLEEIETGADSNIESATAERDAAVKAESDHQAEVMKIKGEIEKVDEHLKSLLHSRDFTRTIRDKAEEAVQHLDYDSLKAELLGLEQNFACQYPNSEISTKQLELSNKQRSLSLEDQKQINKLLHEFRGKLELSGGEVLREKLEAARAELDRLVEEAIDQELEYDALYHLQQTLLQTNQQYSAHLGRSLARPVSEQFSALTGQRYTELQIDPDLQLKTVASGNSERQHEALSVGTRHQLATLIRLALAAQMQTTVVLDDQLVHSDTDRLFWFRDCLRQTIAENQIQVIVITCRPHDYVTESELQMAVNPLEKSDHGNLHITRLVTCMT